MRIATFPPGSIQDTVLKKWLTRNGIDADADLDIVAMGPGDAVTAMAAQAVDAVFLPHPYPAIIELEGNGNMVLASGDMWPNHTCCCLTVTGELIQEHPDIVEQVIRTRPYFAIELFPIKFYEKYAFIYSYMQILMSDPNSILYFEIEHNRDTDRNKYTLYRSNRLLYALFSDIKTAERLSIWAPVGDFAKRYLDDLFRNPREDPYNNAVDDFHETERWKSSLASSTN